MRSPAHQRPDSIRPSRRRVSDRDHRPGPRRPAPCARPIARAIVPARASMQADSLAAKHNEIRLASGALENDSAHRGPLLRGDGVALRYSVAQRADPARDDGSVLELGGGICRVLLLQHRPACDECRATPHLALDRRGVPVVLDRRAGLDVVRLLAPRDTALPLARRAAISRSLRVPARWNHDYGPEPADARL